MSPTLCARERWRGPAASVGRLATDSGRRGQWICAGIKQGNGRTGTNIDKLDLFFKRCPSAKILFQTRCVWEPYQCDGNSNCEDSSDEHADICLKRNKCKVSFVNLIETLTKLPDCKTGSASRHVPVQGWRRLHQKLPGGTKKLH